MRIFIFCCFILNCCFFSAQTVIGTQGNSSWNSACSIDYTIGEVVIAYGSDSTTHLTQGFHQPVFEITSVETIDISFEVTIYPNPAVDQVNIIFKEINQILKERDKIEAERSLNFLKDQLSKKNIPVLERTLSYMVQQEMQKLMLAEISEDYVLVDINDNFQDLKKNVYRGWMISSSPEVTAFEHPIYDLWLLGCINDKTS